MRSTRLRTADGTVVVVPNVKLADDNLHNWGKPKVTGVDLSIVTAIASDTPRAKVDAFVEGLRTAFSAQPGARPGARAALDEIGPGSLVIKLAGSFDAGTDTTAAKHKLLGDVVDLARELGVDFCRPDQQGPLRRAGHGDIVRRSCGSPSGSTVGSLGRRAWHASCSRGRSPPCRRPGLPRVSQTGTRA